MMIPPAISRFMTVSLGMEENAAGKDAVARAVETAMRREGICDLKDYEKRFSSSEEARQHFIDAIVVGETWFFRDRGPFACLARHARALSEARLGDVLNVLSAPCSTGEEPYSIVMTLLAAGLKPESFAVDGVDISAEALRKARQASYGSGAFRGNIGKEVAGFFQMTPDGRRVADPVIRQVNFYQHNLLSPGVLAGRGPYSVIFCRNLLIYLTASSRLRIFELLDRLLLPGGLLFAGHTETIFWHQQGYLPLQWDRGFALAKPALQPQAKSKTAPAGKPPVLSARRPEKSIPSETIREAASSRIMPDPDAARPDSKPQPVISRAKSASAMAEKIQEARRLADGGDLHGAMHLCREHTRTAGPTAEAFCLMGVIHMAIREMDEAEDCFRKALYLDPGHYETLVHLSLLCRKKGDERKAALYRDRALRQAQRQGKTGAAALPFWETGPDEIFKIWTN